MKHTMHKAAFIVTAAVLLTGCGNSTQTTDNKPLILAAIGGASELGTHQGLVLFAKSNNPGALEAATALKKSISTDLIPYLRGGKLGTAAEVQALINSSLFAKVDPTIRNAISAAAAVLEGYLKVPASNSFLTPDQIDYNVAFLEGVAKGCDDFTTRAIPPKRWIEPAP